MTHRIVIAEDEPDIRSNLTRLLQLEQYEVWAAPNGAEALELVRQHLPDLVLSDVMMPRMSGHELIHAMRGDTLLAHIPAILLTARAEHSDVREGMNLGADDYLVKPFKRDELLAAVRGRLERAASQQAVHRRLQDEARRLLHFDAPTNLPNRALLLERCALALLPTADAPSVVVAMVVIALDGLGQINQALGHAGGDEVLCQIAARLQTQLAAATAAGASSLVGRTAGKQFGLVLAAVPYLAALPTLLQQLCGAVAAPCSTLGRDVFVEARVGVALSGPGTSAQDLLRQAEVALDQTHEEGASRISFFSADRDSRVLRRMRLHSELHKALERQELSLHYQAQVAMDTEQIIGFEALMRWTHPELGAVSPAEFIPIAEESGLILAMGSWALDEVCRQSRAWRDAGLRPVRLAVNLSTRQFGDDKLLADVASALARHQIPADQLELEITESVALTGFERTITLLTAFKQMGLLLSIDDFGTGYSSLAYLKRFPVDALKVDQSFVRNIDTDAGDAAITRAVVALAHSFGLSVIAEGVETLAQRDYLRALGCEYAQGYWFSKPVPPDQAALLLARGLHLAAR
jgi:diguanylate cyclase (GGDEF)-like protein